MLNALLAVRPWAPIRPRRRMDYVSRLVRRLRRDMRDLERRCFAELAP
jgi:hypothetical protein